MHRHDQWIWYTVGIILTLAWKWQRYCYSQKGTGDPPKTFWDSSLEWWEIETLGSQISWGVTIGVVWAIGAALIDRVGVEWLFGGVLKDVPIAPPWLLLLGAMAEMTVPALTKWICSKLPFATFDDMRKP
jgi:hypothetical protein